MTAISELYASSGTRGVEAWRACLERHMLPGLEIVEPEATERRPIEAHLASLRLAGARLWSLRASAQRVRRQVTLHRGFMPVAILQLEGRTRLQQDGRECVLGPGSFAYVDAADAIQLDHFETFEQIYLQFPSDAFVPGAFRRAVSIAMNRCVPNDLPFFECARSLWTAAPTLDPAEGRSALGAMLSLCQCTSAFRHVRDEVQLSPRVRRALEFIDEHLGDEGLSPETVSRSQDVSRRYLDELFVPTGHRIEYWIWERRLVTASEELVRGEGHVKSILQLAVSLGFKSASHFSCAFSKRFGQSPRDYRSAAMTRCGNQLAKV